MSRCLVTGGAGFIGARVARALLDEGYEVTVMDDLSGGHLDNLDPRARFVRCDIIDHDAVGEAFIDGRFEVIHHFAASPRRASVTSSSGSFTPTSLSAAST